MPTDSLRAGRVKKLLSDLGQPPAGAAGKKTDEDEMEEPEVDSAEIRRRKKKKSKRSGIDPDEPANMPANTNSTY